MKNGVIDVANPSQVATLAQTTTKMWANADSLRRHLNESSRRVEGKRGQKMIVERPQHGQPRLGPNQVAGASRWEAGPQLNGDEQIVARCVV